MVEEKTDTKISIVAFIPDPTLRGERSGIQGVSTHTQTHACFISWKGTDKLTSAK